MGGNIDELGAEIRRLGPWHHDVEAAPGVWTGSPAFRGEPDPVKGSPSILRPDIGFSEFVQRVYPDGLAGRSFLDCACNGGGYLLAARDQGAGRCFGFDARAHWIEQARFLARCRPDAGIEAVQCALQDVPALGLTPFDVTLFSGLFYHLPDPVAGLKIAADLTRELIILNTAIRPGEADGLVLSQESTTEVMSGVDGLAWMPTGEPVLRQILAWCGFPHVRLRFARSTAPGYARLELWGAREARTFAHYDRHHPQPAAPRRPGRLRRVAARLGLRRRS